MRNINCRNIQREIEEAGSADLLSSSAIAHLEACVACETLSKQQTKLHALVSSLGTVEAPGDFDFRLRARLAGEKRRDARTLPFWNLSFGMRSTAVAASLLLIGAVFAIVSFRARPDNAVGGGKQVASVPASIQKQPEISGTVSPVTTAVNKAPSGPIEADFQPIEREKRGRTSRNELAAFRGNRLGTRDLSDTGASIQTRDDQIAGSYPSAAFPINASYQSHKVSVDNGRGTSRTISLPSVSFGSQRTLSQTPSPLIASARDSW